MTSIPSTRLSMCLIAAILVTVLPLAPQVSIAQEASVQRTPAHILPAERAGILLSPGRDALEQPETTLDLMGLKDGDIVADIGCGNGYYTLRVAERIAPHGHVLASDIQQGMLDQLTTRMTEAGIRNVYPILGDFDDPYLPPGKVDWVLLVDVYHEFSDPAIMLARIKDCLAPTGKVALLEYRAEQDPATIPFPIPRDHKMTVDEVMAEWTPAGFALVERIEVLPAQHLFIFRVADDRAWHEGLSIRKMDVGDTSNVSTFGGTLYFSGQPAEADFETFASFGVKTVINLRTAPEIEGLDFDERNTVEGAGMTYINLPMGRELPNVDALETILSTVEDALPGPVLLHCGSSNRVGAIWAVYTATRHGLSIDDSIAQGKAAGMRAHVFEEGLRALAR